MSGFILYQLFSILVFISLLVGLVYLGSILVKYLKIQLEVSQIKKEKLALELEQLKTKSGPLNS